MKYVIILNDGNDILHLGSNLEVSAVAKGVYYTLMSIANTGEEQMDAQMELIKKLNIGVKEFNQAVRDLEPLGLVSQEKNGENTYITFFNTSALRESLEKAELTELDREDSKKCLAIAEHMARGCAFVYQRGYTNQYKYQWFHTIKTMATKMAIDVDTLGRASVWIIDHLQDKYMPCLQNPKLLITKWGTICKMKRNEDEKQNKGIQHYV